MAHGFGARTHFTEREQYRYMERNNRRAGGPQHS